MFTQNELLVPLITPFYDNEEINYNELAKITKYLAQNGADGFFAVGSSAECFMLDLNERKKALETIIENADGKKVIAHVGDIGIKKTLELVHHAEKSGASMIGSVPPFYFNFTYENIKDYYFEIADNTSLPIMIYYMPNSTGNMGVRQIVDIINGRKNITALKYTDNDYNQMQIIKNYTNAKIYSGRDECFLSATIAGTNGAVGTTFNCMLDKYRQILQCLDTGEFDLAQKIQTNLCLLIDIMVKNNIFNSTKFLMDVQGFNTGYARRPYKPLTDLQKKEILTKYNNL